MRPTSAPCGRTVPEETLDPCEGCPQRGDAPEEPTCALWVCCVQERGLRHYGLCLDFPCLVFLGHADALTVGRRYQALLRQREG
jgi:hypothetical protein